MVLANHKVLPVLWIRHVICKSIYMLWLITRCISKAVFVYHICKQSGHPVWTLRTTIYKKRLCQLRVPAFLPSFNQINDIAITLVTAWIFICLWTVVSIFGCFLHRQNFTVIHFQSLTIEISRRTVLTNWYQKASVYEELCRCLIFPLLSIDNESSICYRKISDSFFYACRMILHLPVQSTSKWCRGKM